MTNKHGRLWNKHFAVTFCGTRCYKVTEKKNLHTCLPEDETVESHSHGPHVQRLQESCHKEHLMWHGGKGAEKTYIAGIRKQTTLTGVGADGPPPVIYGTFFFKACLLGPSDTPEMDECDQVEARCLPISPSLPVRTALWEIHFYCLIDARWWNLPSSPV